MRADGERRAAEKRAALTPRAAGRRVTVGDVAARAGLQLSEASAALNSLAADTGAALKVSEAGDLLYLYRPGLRAALAAKSWRLRLAPAFAKARKRARGRGAGHNSPYARAALAQAQETGSYLVRVAFGSTLFISIFLVRGCSSARCVWHQSTRRQPPRGAGGGRRHSAFDQQRQAWPQAQQQPQPQQQQELWRAHALPHGHVQLSLLGPRLPAAPP